MQGRAAILTVLVALGGILALPGGPPPQADPWEPPALDLASAPGARDGGAAAILPDLGTPEAPAAPVPVEVVDAAPPEAASPDVAPPLEADVAPPVRAPAGGGGGGAGAPDAAPGPVDAAAPEVPIIEEPSVAAPADAADPVPDVPEVPPEVDVVPPAPSPTLETKLRVRDAVPEILQARAARDPMTGLAYVLFQARDGNGRDDLVAADAVPAAGERVALAEVPLAPDLPVAVDGLTNTGATRTWLATLRFDGTDARVTLSATDRVGAVGVREVVVEALPVEALPDADGAPVEDVIEPTVEVPADPPVPGTSVPPAPSLPPIPAAAPVVFLVGAAFFGARQRR